MPSVDENIEQWEYWRNPDRNESLCNDFGEHNLATLRPREGAHSCLSDCTCRYLISDAHRWERGESRPFVEGLFIAQNHWKQPKYFSVGKWINNLHVPTVECYMAVIKNEPAFLPLPGCIHK